MKEISYEKIKEIRVSKFWSQSDLALKAGVSASAISQIESGSRIPSILILRKIASALGTTIDYLTGDECEKNDCEARAYYRNLQEMSELQRKSILAIIDVWKHKNLST